MKPDRSNPRRAAIPAALLTLLLAACAATLDVAPAHARSPLPPQPWPPSWQDGQHQFVDDFTPPAFEAPRANDCRRAPTTREVPGGGEQQSSYRRDRRADRYAERAAGAGAVAGVVPSAPPAVAAPAPAMSAEMRAERSTSADLARPGPAMPAPAAKAAAPAVAQSFAPEPWPRPERQPRHEGPVTAGVVDDNADFGEYLSYRRRNTGLPVRDRDVGERHLLEVTDASGRPVHDAEVAVQRQGAAEPVMWARTDTAGKVWLHPRAFMAPGQSDLLGVAVRKNGQQSRAILSRGQRQTVQVRLGEQADAPARLDLVFMIDATGSMGDEIAKLKRSMRAMADQIAQLPGRPDICWGLVAYRDRGDAFLTRTHDFTNDLAAFQQVLARVEADGGGDTPEALNEALHEVVHGLAWRRQAARLVVMVADAPPHLDYGGPQYDRDMQAALAKGIKLFAVGASGLDPVGEYVFRQLAQYTAGRFVFLTYRDASDPGSGPGTETVHDVKQYSVQTLDKLVVRLVADELAKLRRG